MTECGIAGLHWVRYGIAGDQKYLLKPFDKTYDQLVVNANMVANMPSAMSQFLSQRLNKPFVIDPQTHAFQHEIDNLLSTSKKSEGELKRSWNGLVEHYGSPLDKVIAEEKRSLLPSDLSDNDILQGFCERVLFFQRDEITREIEEGEDSEYIRFLAEKGGKDLSKVPPAMLIAPYFFIGGPLQDEWIELNSRCLEVSRQILNECNSKIPLAAQVVISKDVLSDLDLREKVANAFIKHKPDVVLIWIDGFSEQLASPTQLKHFIELVNSLANGNRPVVNLYGGFFSIIQARIGELKGKLCGISHGLEYGESKPVIPIAGGVPVSRFYSNNLHFRLPGRVAYNEIKFLNGFDSVKKYYEMICDCAECKEIIRDDPNTEFIKYTEAVPKSIFRSGRRVTMEYPTAAAADHCTRHYMWCKGKEYNSDIELSKLKTKLQNACEKLAKHVGSEFAAHAKVWADIL